MRQCAITVLILMGMLLPSWSQEKALVETYLAELQASNEAFKRISKEVDSFAESMQGQLSSPDFDFDAVKAQFHEFVQRMEAQLASLEGLVVPEQATKLQEISVEQYQMVIFLIRRIGPMLELTQQMSMLTLRANDEEIPGSAESLLNDMEVIKTQMAEIQADIEGSATRGKALDLAAKSEKQRLRVEFGIGETSSKS